LEVKFKATNVIDIAVVGLDQADILEFSLRIEGDAA